jgi:uncharacterized protein (DUF58 family)
VQAEVQVGNEETGARSVGYLLTRFGLLFLLCLFLLSAWLNHVATAVLLGIVLCAAGVAKAWSRVSLWRVDVHRSLSGRRVFPGESIQVTVRVTNRKPLPLPWIQIQEEIPLNIVPDPPSGCEPTPGGQTLSRMASLLWYSAVSWKWRLRCERRGYYLLRPNLVTSGDIFGLYPHSGTNGSNVDEIIVYPRIFPIRQLRVPSLHPMGETRAERRFLGDPTRTMGIRDYRPQDSLRRIHWKASARHQELLVKVYEPTASVRVALFLAMESFHGSGGWDDESLELGISTAASVAHELLGRGCPVGLFVNTRLADSDQAVSVPPGASVHHEANILEALAKVTSRMQGPFAGLVEREIRTLPWGSTIALVIGPFSDCMEALVHNLRARGYKLLLLRAETSQEPGVPVDSPWQRIIPAPISEGMRVG